MLTLMYVVGEGLGSCNRILEESDGCEGQSVFCDSLYLGRCSNRNLINRVEGVLLETRASHCIQFIPVSASAARFG